jgi:chemotaxis protein MotB
LRLGAIAGGLLALVTLASGCQYFPSGKLAAADAQNRALAEESKAQLAEIENLKVHSRRMEENLRRAEEDLALLDEEIDHNRDLMASYQRERDALLGGGRYGLPAGVSRRLSELAARYPSLEFDAETGISKLDSDVLFDTADSSLRPEAKKLLHDFAAIFQETDARDLKIMVVGHTDNRAVAKKPTREKYPDNWHLSTARALAVADYLRDRGLPEDRMGIAGFAEHQPIMSNASAREREKNRRVEIFVMGPETPVVGWTETHPAIY